MIEDSALDTFQLRICSTLPDYSNGPHLVPCPQIWISATSFQRIKSSSNYLTLKQGNYILLRGFTGQSFARLTVASDETFTGSDAKDIPCVISSLVAMNLFHTYAVKDQTIEIVRVPQQRFSIASSVTLSVMPFCYFDRSKQIQNLPTIHVGLATQHLLPNTIVFTGSFFAINWYNRLDLVKVLAVGGADSSSPMLIKETTKVEFVDWNNSFLSDKSFIKPIRPTVGQVKGKILESLAGLEDLLDELADLVFANLELSSPLLPRGFLFVGPSGSGKSLLASEFAKHCGLKPILVNAPEIFASGEGESETRLTRLFEEICTSPSMLIIDELEGIASNRRSMVGVIERRLLSHFLNLMDRFWDDAPSSFIIGIASNTAALDPAIMRPKRFERVLQFKIPSPEARLAIFKLETAKFPIFDANRALILQQLAHRTPGFTGADIANLCRHVITHHLTRHIAPVSISGKDAAGKDVIQEAPPLDWTDFEPSLSVVKASSLSGYSTLTSYVSFDELCGVNDIIAKLKASVLAPFDQAERFQKLGAKPPAGVLLYGPPGVGKSKLVMALASACRINFITANATELISKVVGESEQALAQVFRSARAAAPCILFLDQIESIARARGQDSSEEQSSDRILSLLLTEMDGINKSHVSSASSSPSNANEALIVLAATNKPHMLDSAVLRPGRFDEILFIPPPNPQARLSIISYLASKTPCPNVTEDQWRDLSKITKGYSGADLESLFREASYLALKRNMETDQVTWGDINDAMKVVPASLLKVPITHPYNKQVGFSFLT